MKEGNQEIASGALTVDLQSTSLPGFDEYFMSLNPDLNKRNPWFREYWQVVNKCYFRFVIINKCCRHQCNINHPIQMTYIRYWLTLYIIYLDKTEYNYYYINFWMIILNYLVTFITNLNIFSFLNKVVYKFVISIILIFDHFEYVLLSL